MVRQISQGFTFITLAGWGTVLVAFAQTGQIKAYLAPAFCLLVEPAGYILVGLALLYLFFVVLNRNQIDDDPCRTSATRLKARHVFGFLMVSIPVVLAVFSEAGYSAQAVLNKGLVEDVSTMPGVKTSMEKKLAAAPTPVPAPSVAPTPAAVANTPQEEPLTDTILADPSPEQFIPRTASGDIKAEVVDLLYAAQEPTLRKDFEGNTVELIGQFMPDLSATQGSTRFRLLRMFMVCCAADARPLAVAIEPGQKPDVAEMSWLRVVGTAQFERLNGGLVPVVKAKIVEPTDAPAEPMIY